MNEIERPSKICIIDFGGQYAHLIASRIRRLGIYTEILSNEESPESYGGYAGIILSGGPSSVYEEGAPGISKEIFTLNIPILGICYGHQLIMKNLDGEVKRSEKAEFGRAELEITGGGRFTEGIDSGTIVWMSHGDEVVRLPEGFHTLASTENCSYAGVIHHEKKIIGIQFHPEVTHTEEGEKFLKNFIELTGAKKTWNMENFLEEKLSEIRSTVPDDKNIFLLVSGGVDSTVAYVLLAKALGKERVRGLLIDTGFMRKNEVKSLAKVLKKLEMNLLIEDASVEYYNALKNCSEPEEKRKIIGSLFLDVKNRVKHKYIRDPENWLLGQGTIYPDTIESGGTRHSRSIKTHHNRVDEILELIKEGKVIEPLKELYKDEVRALGKLLGLEDSLIERHPFPGPGLAVRMISSYSDVSLENFHSLFDTLKNYKDLKLKILPVKSVGVQGDERTYRNCAVLNDFTGDWNQYNRVSTLLTNTHREINRVVVQPFQKFNDKPFRINPLKLNRKFTDLLREADYEVMNLISKFGIDSEIWQMPVALLPLGTKKKSYSIVLRPVESTEAMTANFYPMKRKFLKKIVHKLLKISGISAVFYDITNKPPGTIEWE